MSDEMDSLQNLLSIGSNRLISALAHPVVLKVLVALHDSPASVSALAERLEVALPAVSRRLADLQEFDLVTYQKKGRHRIYALTKLVHVELAHEQCVIAVTAGGTSIRIRYQIQT